MNKKSNVKKIHKFEEEKDHKYREKIHKFD